MLFQRVLLPPNGANAAALYGHRHLGNTECCSLCAQELKHEERAYASLLCDTCYDALAKQCEACGRDIPLDALHYNTSLCNSCYDAQKARSPLPPPASPPLYSAGVRMLIGAQLVFYMAPAVLLPSLYLEITRTWPAHAAAVYASVLTTTTCVAMAAPVPLGLWAERRGEREAYTGVTVVATLAALLIACARGSVAAFALGWALLSVPTSLRGVRAVYFARNVRPEELSRAGQLASATGLVGSVAGPLLASMRFPFTDAALLAAALHALCALGLAAFLPAPPGRGHSVQRAFAATGAAAATSPGCERCGRALTAAERTWDMHICDVCYDQWWKHHKRRTLLWSCAVASLLEISMNIVVTVFQPIAVDRFGWKASEIAAVNLLSAGLSIAVSLGSAQLRLPEWSQAMCAAMLYVCSVLLATAPPVGEARLVSALVLGLKAQILFMAPFTAIFSHLLGSRRITNTLTTALCLAPLAGAAVGAALAPLALRAAGSPWFMLSAFPAVVALTVMALVRWRLRLSAGGALGLHSPAAAECLLPCGEHGPEALSLEPT